MAGDEPHDRGDEAPDGGRPFGFMSRRRWLKLGLGAVALPLGAAALGAGGLLALRGCAPDVEGLAVLGDQGYRTLASLARTHLPRGGPFPEGADDVDLARTFDAWLADEPPENIRDLERALLLVELAPVVFGGRGSTFSNLEPADQLAEWSGWMSSDRLVLRQASLAFRKFFALVFYDTPAVWPHIGYPGPSLRGGG